MLARALWLLVPAFAIAACGSPSEAHPPSVDECSQKAKPASDKVAAVIAANAACTTDADCVTVAVNASCFDHCTSAVASSGRAAVERAVASASANECQSFATSGCKLIVPPCAPPSPPACRAGKCM